MRGWHASAEHLGIPLVFSGAGIDGLGFLTRPNLRGLGFAGYNLVPPAVVNPPTSAFDWNSMPNPQPPDPSHQPTIPGGSSGPPLPPMQPPSVQPPGGWNPPPPRNWSNPPYGSGLPSGGQPPIVVMPAPSGGPSLAKALLTTLATTILGLSLAMNLFFLLSSVARQSSGPVREELIQSGDTSRRIAVLPISGVIDAEMSRWFDQLATRVEKDVSIHGVVLELDTPGGGVTASDQIYRRILKLKQELSRQGRANPVVASMGSTAASGGYYIACAADSVYAEPTTITGSIGVLLQNFNVYDGMQKIGVRDASVIASGATFKDAGSPFKPQSPEAANHLQDVTDRMFDIFKDVVKTGRGDKLKAPIDDVANGKVFTGRQAADLGLVDQVDGLDAACAHAGVLAGVANPTIVRWTRQPSLLGLLSVHTDAADGLNVSLDPSRLDSLLTPRLMYLWRG